MALPSLKQLQYLVVLSEYLNFTRAAEVCFVTQPTLSAGIRELESLLGAALVERDRQNVLMTDAGRDVVARARPLLAQCQDLVDAARASASMQGRVRLGVIPTIAPFLLSALMKSLGRRYPELCLAVREDLTRNLLERLESGHLDFVLMALPHDTSGFRVEALFDDDLWLVGSRKELNALGESVRMTRHVTDRLLLLEEGHCLRDHVLAACRKPPASLAGGMEATSLLTLVQMVRSGAGLGLIPSMALQAGLITGSGLEARPVMAPVPRRTVALVARTTTTKEAELGALCDLLHRLFDEKVKDRAG